MYRATHFLTFIFMKIFLQKFGTTLTSRQMGKEALSALQPLLAPLGSEERVEIDFSGVGTFSPSWADEFLIPLFHTYHERLRLHPSDNAAVQTTIKFLEDVHQVKFLRA